MQTEKQPNPKLTYTGQKTRGVVTSRSHETYSPRVGESFKPTDRITIELPQSAWLDPDDFFISMKTRIFPGNNNVAETTRTANIPNSFRPVNDFVLSAPDFDEFGGRLVQFKPGIQTIFSRVRLLCGLDVVEDIQDYHVFYRSMMCMRAPQDWKVQDGVLYEGWYSFDDAESRMYNANLHTDNKEGPTYVIKPLLGLLQAQKYIPLKYMNTVSIELTLNVPSECLLSTVTNISNFNQNVDIPGTEMNLSFYPGFYRMSTKLMDYNEDFSKEKTIGPNLNVQPTVLAQAINREIDGYDLWREQDQNAYIIDNEATKRFPNCTTGFSLSSETVVDYPEATYEVFDVKAHVNLAYPSGDYDSTFKKVLNEEGVSIDFESFSTIKRNIPKFSTTVNVTMQHRMQSVRGVFACMRNSSQGIDTDISFQSNGIQNYQWTVGKLRIPNQPVDCTNPGEPLAEIRKLFNVFVSSNDQYHKNTLHYLKTLPSINPIEQLDAINALELKAGSSLPNEFFMALDLEKSPGQLSGFDSAASSSDFELQMKLSPWSFGNAHPNTGFQPVKRLVHWKNRHRKLWHLNNFRYEDNYKPDVPGVTNQYAYYSTPQTESRWKQNFLVNGNMHNQYTTVEQQTEQLNYNQFYGLRDYRYTVLNDRPGGIMQAKEITYEYEKDKDVLFNTNNYEGDKTYQFHKDRMKLTYTPTSCDLYMFFWQDQKIVLKKGGGIQLIQ
jgi:hypothetical protein